MRARVGTRRRCSLRGGWRLGYADEAAGQTNVTVRAEGDAVTLVKSLKVSGGGGGTIKVGTKVPGIRLLDEPVAGHDIDARVPGFGKMHLKSSVVKKAS